jgi:hypothetical protein
MDIARRETGMIKQSAMFPNGSLRWFNYVCGRHLMKLINPAKRLEV